MACRFTDVSTVCSTVCSNEKRKYYWPFVRRIHRWGCIPITKGQWCGKRFHVGMLSCSSHQSVPSTPYKSRCDISNVIHFKIDWIWSMLCVGVFHFHSYGCPHFHWALCRYKYTSEQVMQQSRESKYPLSRLIVSSVIPDSLLSMCFFKHRQIYSKYIKRSVLPKRKRPHYTVYVLVWAVVLSGAETVGPTITSADWSVL